MDITGQHLSDMRRQAEFILVSNEEKNKSRERIGKKIMKKILTKERLRYG